MNDPLVQIEQDGAIGLVKLNRPAKRNAINDRLIAELGAYFSALPSGVRCVILHGEGEHFCAGLDLIERMAARAKTTEQADSLAGVRHSRGWHRVFDLIEYCEAPVISVLKGGVIGGGLELAAATHVRIAESSTFYQLPEGQRGIFVGGGASVRVPQIIGKTRVTEMMLTGRKIDADEGARLALSHYLVGAGEGMVLALELAKKIAANSPVSNFAITNGVSHITAMPPHQGLFTESLMATLSASAVESRSAERIKSFFDKTDRSV